MEYVRVTLLINGVLDGLSIKYEIGNTFQIETLYKDGKVVSTKTVFNKK